MKHVLPNSSALVAMHHPSPILNVPRDIVLEIFKRVKTQDLGACQRVCSQWNQLFSNNEVCANLLGNHFPFYRLPDGMKDFQKAYQAQSLLHSNFTNCVYASESLVGHSDSPTNHVIEADGRVFAGSVNRFAISDGKLFSGSGDKTIKIWDLSTGACLATLPESHSITTLAVSGGKLVCGYVNPINVWDLNTNTLLKPLRNEHAFPIVHLAISEGKVFYSSIDRTIRVLDINTDACMATLTGHSDRINLLAISGGKLFSCSDDQTIKVWDTNTYSCLATLTGHTARVCFLAISDGKLFSSSDDQTIKVWDVETHTCLTTLGNSGVGDLAASAGKLFCASNIDRKIRIWDLNTMTHLATTGKEEGPISCFAAFGEKLFFGTRDKNIKVWNFAAGHSSVFEELAEVFESGSPELIQWTWKNRLLRMPKTARKKIGELYKTSTSHNDDGQKSTPGQKMAQAIRTYLKEQREAETNPLKHIAKD